MMFSRRREQRPRPLLLSYRNTFDRSADGKLVLKHLLGTYGLLSHVETEEQRIRHNVGVELLEHLGVVQGLNWDAFVDALLRLTIPNEAIEQEAKPNASR